MARMSVDDQIGRDPRITWLANELGWSKRELVGCFILELWPLCYDRLTPYLTKRDIDVATGFAGFTELLVMSGLATSAKDGIRISGATERIEYLLRAKKAGRRGGKASGISRRSKEPSRGASMPPQGSLNLPDPVPLLAPVPDHLPDPAGPPVPNPPAGTVLRAVPLEPRDAEISRLIRLIAPLHVEAYNEVRIQIGSLARPMQPIFDPAERALQKLLHELPSLEGFEDDAKHAIRIRRVEAVEIWSLKWFGAGMWSLQSFAKAKTLTEEDVRGSTTSTRSTGPTALALAELAELERKERDE